MSINIKPLGERVLVKPIEEQNKIVGGILLPEKSKEKSNQGEVIAIGKLEKDIVNVGDKVLFAKYLGTEIEIDNQQYIILEIKDVLAII